MSTANFSCFCLRHERLPSHLHTFLLLWLSILVLHVDFISATNPNVFLHSSYANSNGTSGDRLQKRSHNCDQHGVSERCFQQLWKLDVSTIGNNCENYDRLEYCYTRARGSGCDDTDALHIASAEYFKAQGKLLPPEIFEELKIQLKIKCFSKCDDVFLERQCSHTMKQSDKDRDYAVELEFDGQLRQYRLDMYLPSQGCATVRKTMAKWLSFRRRTCGEPAATCLCQKMKERLDTLRCVLTCDQMKLAAPVRSVSPASATSHSLSTIRSSFATTLTLLTGLRIVL